MPSPDLDHSAISRRIARHFPTRFDREWVKWKLLADPLFASLVGSLREPALPVLDVGCGRGLLGPYLRECGLAAPYLGVDFDASKIEPARHVAARYAPGLDYHLLDARRDWPDATGHVCLLDVLHYLPAAEQADLLGRCAARVAPGGCLIIRSGVRVAGWRFHFTSGTDRVMAALGLMKSPPSSYPRTEEISAVLTAAGLQLGTHVAPPPSSFFHNHLMVYHRVAPRGQAGEGTAAGTGTPPDDSFTASRTA